MPEILLPNVEVLEIIMPMVIVWRQPVIFLLPSITTPCPIK